MAEPGTVCVKDLEYASENGGDTANIQPATSAAGESELRMGREQDPRDLACRV